MKRVSAPNGFKSWATRLGLSGIGPDCSMFGVAAALPDLGVLGHRVWLIGQMSQINTDEAQPDPAQERARSGRVADGTTPPSGAQLIARLPAPCGTPAS